MCHFHSPFLLKESFSYRRVSAYVPVSDAPCTGGLLPGYGCSQELQLTTGHFPGLSPLYQMQLIKWNLEHENMHHNTCGILFKGTTRLFVAFATIICGM